MMARMLYIRLSVYARVFPDRQKERMSLQIPILDTQHMLLDFVQYYSVHTAMSPILRT